jgi:hypothetical protein
MDKYIFNFVLGFFLLSLYDRCFFRKNGLRVRQWLINWRPNMTIAILAMFVSLFLNWCLGRL